MTTSNRHPPYRPGLRRLFVETEASKWQNAQVWREGSDGQDPESTYVDYDTPEETSLRIQVGGIVTSALRAMDPLYSRALELRIIEDRPYDEIARDLGITMDTARQHVVRGLIKLRDNPQLKEVANDNAA